jgi:predicted Rossmann fold nucleotide-binding protein DprA/Smf involved in DNA uptake
MRVAVIGSRSFTNYKLLSDTLTKFNSEPNQEITAIISGGAQGADKLAEVFGEANDTVG